MEIKAAPVSASASQHSKEQSDLNLMSPCNFSTHMSSSYLDEGQVPHDHLPHVLGCVHLTNISLKGETRAHKVNNVSFACVCARVYVHVCMVCEWQRETQRWDKRSGPRGGVRSQCPCPQNCHLIVLTGPRGNGIHMRTRTHTDGLQGATVCVQSSDPNAHTQCEDQNRESPLLFSHFTFTSAAGSETSGHIKTHVSQCVRASASCLESSAGCESQTVCIAKSGNKTAARDLAVVPVNWL